MDTEKNAAGVNWRKKTKTKSTHYLAHSHEMGLINEMKNKLNENKITPRVVEKKNCRNAHITRSLQFFSGSMGIVFGNCFSSLLFLVCQCDSRAHKFSAMSHFIHLILPSRRQRLGVDNTVPCDAKTEQKSEVHGRKISIKQLWLLINQSQSQSQSQRARKFFLRAFAHCTYIYIYLHSLSTNAITATNE